MSIVRVYKSTDPGAPPHPSEVRGSMAALLRACLVTGYGSGDFTAEPAGWEEPYPETNNCACFRALSGVRQFYQVNDNLSDADVTRMVMYDSMSDAATGVGSNGDQYFGKQCSTSAPGTNWFVIADAKTCYVFLSHSSYPNSYSPHGFGEHYSYIDADPNKAFLAGHTSPLTLPTASAMPMGAASASSAPITLSRGTGSTPEAVGICVPWFTTLMLNGTDSVPEAAPGINYPVVTAQFYSYKTLRPLGALRGIYYPGAYRPKTSHEEFTLGATTFIALDMGHQVTTSRRGQMWVDITGSWEESA